MCKRSNALKCPVCNVFRCQAQEVPVEPVIQGQFWVKRSRQQPFLLGRYNPAILKLRQYPNTRANFLN